MRYKAVEIRNKRIAKIFSEFEKVNN